MGLLNLDIPKKANADLIENIDVLEIDNQIAFAKLIRFVSNTNDRKWLAQWTAWIVSVWLGVVVLILLLNDNAWHLSEGVLITLLTTTTINILGLSFIVLRGHFNGQTDGISEN